MPGRQRWTREDIPDQGGRIAVVTGANSGIGFETARTLACKGAMVIMGCRRVDAGWRAVEQIRREKPAGCLEVVRLDLAELSAVRGFADAFCARWGRLDLLINNAAVMVPPSRQETADGFELQLGTNHLGHFTLTGRLLGPLLSTPGARVVVVSSLVYQIGRLRLDDLQAEKTYRRWRAYGQSKLANLLFAYELQRRLDAFQADVLAVAAHPGWSGTNLQRHMPLARNLNPLFAQKADRGALSVLYAATAPDVEGGGFYGPDGLLELWGGPKRVTSNKRSHDRNAAAGLWAASETLTGVDYAALESRARAFAHCPESGMDGD